MSKTDFKINISEYLSKGWAIFKKTWKDLLAAGLVMFLIEMIPNTLKMIMGWEEGDSALTIISLVSIVLNLVVSMGWTMILIKTVRGQKTQVSDLFAYTSRFLPFALGTFLVSLMTGVGLILFIFPGIYLMMKYMFVPYLILDKNMGVKESLKASGQMTQGIKWQLFAMYIAVLALNILGLIAFVVGIIVTSFVTSLAYILLYEDLYASRVKKSK